MGNVYDGIILFKIIEHQLDKIPKVETKIMVNIGSPDEAFKNHNLPAEGVGFGKIGIYNSFSHRSSSKCFA